MWRSLSGILIASQGRPICRWRLCRRAGSWNRTPPVGYIDSATDFLTEDGEARGRPVGVTIDPREPLIVADNLSNTVWRIGVADQAAASN